MKYFQESQYHAVTTWILEQVETQCELKMMQEKRFVDYVVESLKYEAKRKEKWMNDYEGKPEYDDYILSRNAAIPLKIEDGYGGLIPNAADEADILFSHLPQKTMIYIMPDCSTIQIVQNGIEFELQAKNPESVNTGNSVMKDNSRKEIASNDRATTYRSTFSSIEGDKDCAIKVYSSLLSYQSESTVFNKMAPHPHPNILQSLESNSSAREITMEWAPKGTLYDDIVNNPRQPSQVTLERVTTAKQILSAMIYLHSLRLIHRDIKPQNVFIFNDVVKLADFDLSLILEEGKTKHSDPIAVGTPDYLAPESAGPVISEGFAEYSAASDLWQFGLVLINLIGRGSAYPHRDIDLLKTKMNDFYTHLRLTLVWPNAKWINEGPVRELALSIFQLNPSMRPSTAEAMDILEKEEKRLSTLK